MKGPSVLVLISLTSLLLFIMYLPKFALLRWHDVMISSDALQTKQLAVATAARNNPPFHGSPLIARPSACSPATLVRYACPYGVRHVAAGALWLFTSWTASVSKHNVCARAQGSTLALDGCSNGVQGSERGSVQAQPWRGRSHRGPGCWSLPCSSGPLTQTVKVSRVHTPRPDS